MKEGRSLTLEILSGPLDGAAITLKEEAEWSRAGDGPLAFPWDDELGEPQACFQVDEAGWSLEGYKSPHGTYRINQGERVSTGKIQLAKGDLLKASATWLLVH
jgi:hypothetical protein